MPVTMAITQSIKKKTAVRANFVRANFELSGKYVISLPVVGDLITRPSNSGRSCSSSSNPSVPHLIAAVDCFCAQTFKYKNDQIRQNMEKQGISQCRPGDEKSNDVTKQTTKPKTPGTSSHSTWCWRNRKQKPILSPKQFFTDSIGWCQGGEVRSNHRLSKLFN